MRKVFLIFLLTNYLGLMMAQKDHDQDIWTGEYSIYTDKNTNQAIDSLSITKTNDLKAEDVPAKLEADLTRWVIISEQENKKDSMMVRRFLFNSENNEYEQFGWTELHKTGRIKCIDGGHFFICQTNANTTVDLKGDKPFFTETGIFGVWLHYGLVTLKRIK